MQLMYILEYLICKEESLNKDSILIMYYNLITEKNAKLNYFYYINKPIVILAI